MHGTDQEDLLPHPSISEVHVRRPHVTSRVSARVGAHVDVRACACVCNSYVSSMIAHGFGFEGLGAFATVDRRDLLLFRRMTQVGHKSTIAAERRRVLLPCWSQQL